MMAEDSRTEMDRALDRRVSATMDKVYAELMANMEPTPPSPFLQLVPKKDGKHARKAKKG